MKITVITATYRSTDHILNQAAWLQRQTLPPEEF